MQYECLLAGLPDLSPSAPAPMSLEALDEQLAEVLTEDDKEQLRLLKHRASSGVCAFIRDWQAFNRDLNNLLTAEICKKHGLDAKQHILGEMPDDVDAQVKAVSQMPDLYERERAIDSLRFAWLEERTKLINFKLENVLAYYLQLQMLCRWDKLTTEQGEQVFRAMVADMKKDIKFE